MISEIFTWWNKQTIGTRMWSYFNGKNVGEDEYGNKYFSNKSDTKRWVIYGGQIEATTVNSEWNNWLRFTSINKPEQLNYYDWQLKHLPNQSGTSKAYSPKLSKFNKNDDKKKTDYEKWSPNN